jgi:phosphatidylserine/phosphatidylglycerophosphate/cardiolipin synthase-like enzyme
MNFDQKESGDIQSQQSKNIWDKIEEIQNLLNNKETLSDEEMDKVTQILNQISQETQKTEEKLTHFFHDTIVSKLQYLGFGNHELLQSPQFINSIELLTDGEKAFTEIIKQIEQAKNSIEITIFIWRDDEIGNKLATKLLEAANREVKIIINKDRLGAIFEHAEQGKESFFHTELADNETFNRWIVDIAYDNSNEAKKYKSKDKPSPLLQQMLDHSNIILNIGSVKKEDTEH